MLIYPWVVGSTRYAGHFIAEHPAQAATQAQLARIGKEKAGLGPVPSYLEGSFQVGGKLVNPAAASIFGTSAQVVNTLRGMAEGHPKEAARLTDFLTPAAALGLANITRQSSLGIPFKPEDNFTDIARKTLVDSLPQAALARRIKALATHEDQSRRLFPVKGLSDAIAPFLIGGVAPRSYNPDVMAAQAEREQRESLTPEQRLSSDYKQFHTELRAAMAKVGEQQIPKRVRGRLALRYERASARAKLGSRATSLDSFKSDIALIVKHGWMKPDEAVQAVAWAEKAHKRELSSALGYLSRHYFDPDSLLSKSLSYLRENGSPDLELPRLP